MRNEELKRGIYSYIGKMMGWLICLLLLSSCSSETEDMAGAAGGNTLQMGCCLTRSAVMPPTDRTKLEFFLTSGSGSNQKCEFTYQVEDGRWSTSARAVAGTNYYIYGYMPVQDDVLASAAPLEGSFGNGAVLTLDGLDPISLQDVCIVTGVKGGNTVRRESDITEWNYLYAVQEDDANYVNLLLDHLYAGLTMHFTVSENYAKLRTIKLKEVALLPAETMNTSVQITQAAQTAPVFAFTPGTDAATMPRLMNSGEGKVLSAETPLVTECYVLPCLTELTLKCTYDVYDKKGVLLQKDCTVENNLLNWVSMTPGVRTMLSLAVNPTYLYILSDNDLNNPGINITE